MRIFVSFISLLVLLVAGCSNDVQHKVVSDEQVLVDEGSKAKEKGIWQGAVESSIVEEEKNDGTVTFHYEVKNQTEQVITFHFKENKIFVYELYDEKGQFISRHESGAGDSNEKEIEHKIVQGEALSTTMNFALEKGKYTLNVWISPTNDENDYRQSISFEVK
ncbi:hypothetical protein LCL95_01275 [Bacillus timonensis]|nr:hypothetical protein [Bacillus timonensis]